MSVDFDPVKVGPGPRRVEPLMVGVLVVVAALAVAIVKPWQTGEALDRPPPGLAAATPSAPAPRPSPTAAPPLVALRTPTWQDLEQAIKTHDAWGVRVIFSARRGVKPDPRVRYTEDWTSVVPTEGALETTRIDRDERSIVALGITHPPGSAPQDVQVWRVGRDDKLEPIDARPLDGGRADGALLFLRFGAEDAGFRTWDAGRYRIGMLNEDGVRWVAVEIPARPGGEAPPDTRPAPEALVVGEQAGDPRAVRVGLFASVNGEGLAFEAPDSSVYDASTWFKTSRRPSVASTGITSAYLTRPAWLGVMLPQRALVRWATISPLAADAGFDPLSGGVLRFHGQTPFVVFGFPSGGAWPAGVYAISVAWEDRTGPRIGTWNVELGRSPIQPAFTSRQ